MLVCRRAPGRTIGFLALSISVVGFGPAMASAADSDPSAAAAATATGTVRFEPLDPGAGLTLAGIEAPTGARSRSAASAGPWP